MYYLQKSIQMISRQLNEIKQSEYIHVTTILDPNNRMLSAPLEPFLMPHVPSFHKSM